jgi:ferredoxin
MGLPHPKWLLLEGVRFGASFVDYYTTGGHFEDLPPGDGHPVYLLPGFATNHISTIFIKEVLDKLGYATKDWSYGFNVRFNEELIQHLRDDLDTMYKYHNRKVSIIGLSLGGVYARFLANHSPEKVRSIITLGSPFTGHEPIITYGSYVFDRLNKQKSHELLEKYGGMIHANPTVPSTSIYSKTDGVVKWKYSIQEETAIAENVQVSCGHCALACDPQVIEIIADRLSQPEGDWRKFETW